MVVLKYVGNHKPQGMIIEVDESKVQSLLDSGEYETIGFMKKIIKKEKEDVSIK